MGPRACVLAYDGLCTFEFGICVEIFGKDRPELDVDWYRFLVVADQPGALRMEGGLQVSVSHGLEALEEAELILVPGWSGAEDPVPGSVCRALRRAHRRGAVIASICSGVFVLASAGLLDGRRATTHWRYADRLKERFPEIDVDPDVLYMDEGNILTSAGSAAGLDLGLHIVRKRYGAEVANIVARRLVLPVHRDGGQAQFIPKPVGKQRGGDIGPLMDAMLAGLDQNWPVRRMADAAGLSQRTLIRRFKLSAGESPLSWLTGQRVAHARDLLETTRLSVNEIAERAGFGSPESLRLHFRRRTGVAPLVYRASFSQA